ncbi:phosphotransferase family protein [Nesterenkonia natronophila]|uniref:Phosphotransferase family protein n=1 Tax=Nesterenkonia natronophila TaxID=2174932 RepID=A0A3A4F3Q4_9MICC|nr:phosphotransferase family protein [Nesterenkonia natronophila]RJN32488.1 phosphotransferase family protein [Nesterenkonia natronophila]
MSAEIARNRVEAQQLPMPPLLVLDTVQEFLDAHGLGTGPLEISRIGEGQSNVTFRIRRDKADLVLRRGPRPPLPRSTHDMLREARVQQALAGHPVPVPKIRAVCEDENLLGVPFYVMDYMDGDVLTGRLPDEYDNKTTRRKLSAAMVETLQQLHDVDVAEPHIASLGRPEGYLRRQVERFAQLWPMNTRRDIPLVDELSAWLRGNLPETQRHAVIHGDFRMGNLMYTASTRGTAQTPRVEAVLDWEMATLGDPLADLGYLTATYATAGEAGTVLELTSVTRKEGFHTREELVEAYSRGSSLNLEMLPWYQTMALWKAAIFCEAMYTRYLNGERPGDTFAEGLKHGVPELLDQALQYSKQLRSTNPASR